MKKLIKKDGYTKVITINDQPSLTDQQWAEDCDVNNIMAKYQKTGQITHSARTQGVYADVSDIPDLMESKQRIVDAINQFDSLPQEIKQYYHYDPYDFALNYKPDNHPEKPADKPAGGQNETTNNPTNS